MRRASGVEAGEDCEAGRNRERIRRMRMGPMGGREDEDGCLPMSGRIV